jgi:hypothetical protein
MTTYYKANLMKLSCREYWRRAAVHGGFHRPILTFLFLLAKLVGVPEHWEGCLGLRLEELTIADSETVPEALKANLAKALDECAGPSLELIFFCRYDGPGAGSRAWWEAALLSADGRVYGELSCDSEGSWPSFSCYSPTEQGITLHTTNAPAWHTWREPPFFELQVLPQRCSYRDVVEWHFERIQTRDVRRLEKSRMASYIRDTSNQRADYWVQRGVFVPMSPQEIEQSC